MISVVIPCYNAAATLRETIDSALAQDIEHEVVVVDDGSTDTSVVVLESYGDRVRWVSTENRGASAARTLGTQMAGGAFIQYLDSDDLLMPGALAERKAVMDRTGADVAHADWQKLVQSPDGSFERGAIIRADLAAIAEDAEVAAATSAFWAPPAALLYRRTLVDRIGPWSPRLPVIQDARFLFDAAALGARFVHVPGVGALYRVTAGSLSRRNMAGFIADCARNAEEIETLWRAREPLDERRRKALETMWGHVATSALVHGLAEFEQARAGLNRVGLRRRRLEIAHALRSVLGPAACSTLMGAGLRARAAWRALAQVRAGQSS